MFYRDTIILSAAGGQQGCPLMTACHAVVQHMLLESLGLVAPPAGTALTLPRLEPPSNSTLHRASQTTASSEGLQGKFCGHSSISSQSCRRLGFGSPACSLSRPLGLITASISTHSSPSAARSMAMATLRFLSPPLARTLSVNPTRRVLSTSSSASSSRRCYS